MFEGKVALVTGSSQGIGQVIATKFAEYGADVVVHGLGATDDCKTCQDIRAMGRRTAAYDVDITNVEAVNEMVKDIIAKFGKIDILINNAGMYPAMLVTDVTEKHFDRVIAVNLKGTFFVTQAVVNQSMIPNNYGRIVNVSSIHGFVSRKNVWTAPYCASKGGVHMMTKAMANDWGKYNITVNCIAPGYFPTELTEKFIDSDAFVQLHKDRCPKERHGILGEMDGLCVYFAAPCCTYTTGQIVAVDGGWTCN